MTSDSRDGYSGWGEWFPRLPLHPLETDPNDIKRMMFSAKNFINPSKEVQTLLQEIATNATFARKLKKAAELNQNEKVNELIRSAGVNTHFETKITPDGIRVELQPESTKACFDLTLALCW